ncbi:MAG: hypothetical protein CMH41_09880 [Micrococcales bacterium]|nr:hypothetical protein [Micrococcales bacterium]
MTDKSTYTGERQFVTPKGIVEIIGVYHADGGLVGEGKYFFGKFLGLAHCSLCDITHSPVRRKPEWDRMVQRLGVPVTLLHRNELSPELAQQVNQYGTPVVVARYENGKILPLIMSDAMDTLSGSVEAFETQLTSALSQELSPENQS